MFKQLALLLIKGYQKIIRPILPTSCVFYAHGQLGCSDYTYLSIKEQGFIKGVLLGMRRISRCHPWQKNFND
jgi:putative membrane protein insertion efficiency factor